MAGTERKMEKSGRCQVSPRDTAPCYMRLCKLLAKILNIVLTMKKSYWRTEQGGTGLI